jgi:hypothetical protein
LITHGLPVCIIRLLIILVCWYKSVRFAWAGLAYDYVTASKQGVGVYEQSYDDEWALKYR